MKVRMKVAVSGTRNGVDWPGVGGVLECDSAEGAHLCAGGMAEPVVEAPSELTDELPDEEHAVDTAPVEHAVVPTGKKSGKKPRAR